jgi:hypothetical protein
MTSRKSAMMASEEANSAVRGIINTPAIERNMHLAEEGEVSSVAGQSLGKATRVIFMATSEQWKCNKNGTRLRNEGIGPVSTLGDERTQMEQNVLQQAHNVTQLRKIIDSMARMLDGNLACEEVQWRGMKEWAQDTEKKWDNCH